MRRMVVAAAALVLLLMSACRAQWEEDCLKDGGYPDREKNECRIIP